MLGDYLSSSGAGNAAISNLCQSLTAGEGSQITGWSCLQFDPHRVTGSGNVMGGSLLGLCLLNLSFRVCLPSVSQADIFVFCFFQ